MNSISQDKRAEQIERLRNIVIRQHVRMASGGHTVPNGWSCKLCGAESGTNQELIHKPGCLTGSFSALRTPPADMEGAREQVIEGLVAAICDPECPTQFTPLLMEARKMLASVSALQRDTGAMALLRELNTMIDFGHGWKNCACFEEASDMNELCERVAAFIAENGGQADV